MTSEALPAHVSAAIARISPPTPSPADHVPGELARLGSWWRSVGGGRAPRPAWVAAQADGRASADALAAGLAAVDRAIDEGANLVVPVFEASDPIGARTVIAVLCRAESSVVTYQPPGMTDAEWMSRCAGVRDRAADVSPLRSSPLLLLDALTAWPIAFAAGVLVGASARRTASLVDGTDALAAALVADRLSFRAREWWRAASTSPDPGRCAATERIDLPAGLPLGLINEDGAGARATVALLRMLVEDAG